MDDILSGGRIDQSTSGPAPSNKDDRSRDILLEQKERQEQDAIGGTQFPPKPQPLPPIPEAPEVAPSLPSLPSFDLNISGSALEETREIARQTVVDVLKNVTINGQGPSFEGSTIAFNIPQQPPASEAFVFQGIMVPQPLAQIRPAPPPPPPQLSQPEPIQEIQSFVITPPRQEPQQQTRIEPTQNPEAPEVVPPVLPQTAIAAPEIKVEPAEALEVAQPPPPSEPVTTPTPAPQPATAEGEVEQAPQQPEIKAPAPEQVAPPTFLEPQQPPTTILESDVVNPPVGAPIEKQSVDLPKPPKEPEAEPAKTDGQTQQPKTETTAKTPQTEETKEDEFRPRYKSLSDYPVFDRKREEDGSQTEEKKGDEFKPRYESLSDYPVLNRERQEDKSQTEETEKEEFKPRYESLSDYPVFDREREEARKSTAATSAEEAAEQAKERRAERLEREGDFDRESPIRQRGETQREFQERQKELKEEREQREDFIKRAREGDISEVPSGMVPVAFTRADGERKIFALLASELVGVVEGAEGNERTLVLPPEDSYYEAGGGGVSASPHPWKITLRTIPETDPPEYEYKVEVNSSLYSELNSWSQFEISGLNVWNPALEGFLVLTATVENGICSEVAVVGPDYLPDNRIGFTEDGQQTSFATILGYFYYDENSRLRVLQKAFHDFTLMHVCVNGNAALYPFAT